MRIVAVFETERTSLKTGPECKKETIPKKYNRQERLHDKLGASSRRTGYIPEEEEIPAPVPGVR